MSMSDPSAVEYLSPQPRQWPTVIGILAILWGGVGLVSALWGLVASAMGKAQPGFAQGSLGKAFFVLGSLLSAMILVGGVQLLRRKASGVQLVQAWIPLAILLGAANVIHMVVDREQFEGALREAMEQQMEETSKRTGKPAPQLPEGMVAFMWGSSVACVGLAALVPPLIPVFFVFGRRGREAVAEWTASASGPWQPPA